MVCIDPHPGELGAQYSVPFSGDKGGAVSATQWDQSISFSSINVTINVCLRPFSRLREARQ